MQVNQKLLWLKSGPSAATSSPWTNPDLALPTPPTCSRKLRQEAELRLAVPLVPIEWQHHAAGGPGRIGLAGVKTGGSGVPESGLGGKERCGRWIGTQLFSDSSAVELQV